MLVTTKPIFWIILWPVPSFWPYESWQN